MIDEAERPAYARLELALAADIKPRGAVEWIWLNDLVYLAWEIRQLRRVKATFVALSRDAAAREILGADADIEPPLSDLKGAELWEQCLAEANPILHAEAEAEAEAEADVSASLLAWLQALHAPAAPPRKFAVGSRAAAEREARAKQRLAELGLEPTALDDVAYRLCLADMERLERLITGAETRRNAILRDLDRRRERAANRSASTHDVIDAEFEP